MNYIPVVLYMINYMKKGVLKFNFCMELRGDPRKMHEFVPLPFPKYCIADFRDVKFLY